MKLRLEIDQLLRVVLLDEAHHAGVALDLPLHRRVLSDPRVHDLCDLFDVLLHIYQFTPSSASFINQIAFNYI